MSTLRFWARTATAHRIRRRVRQLLFICHGDATTIRHPQVGADFGSFVPAHPHAVPFVCPVTSTYCVALRAPHSIRFERAEEGEEQWDFHGNKVRSHREQSDVFSCRNRFPSGCYTSSRCAGACAYASAEPGSPRANTS